MMIPAVDVAAFTLRCSNSLSLLKCAMAPIAASRANAVARRAALCPASNPAPILR